VSGSNIFAGTGGGVYLSTNNGTSWTGVNAGLSADTYVNALAVSGSNIFAGAMDGSVYLSTNNGTSWTGVNAGLPVRYTLLCLAVSGSNIFVGFAGDGVFLSTNNGTSWTAVDSGLPSIINVMSLAVSGGNIFAGTDFGVFLSTSNGTSWTAVNAGLTNTTVLSLAVSGNTVFAGTDGSGAWYRSLSEMVAVINPNPQQERIRPYSSEFKIDICKNGIAVLLPESLNNGPVTVELVNIAGRKIYSATHQACNGNLNIPISGLSTGTYLIHKSSPPCGRVVAYM
jgi:hypothetical protein